MNTRNYISITLLIVTTLFSFGQGQTSSVGPVCAESVHSYGVGNTLDGSQFIWTFDQSYGELISGEGSNNITIRWGYSTGTVDIEVLEISSNNCIGMPVTETVEIMAPYVDLGDKFPEICEGDVLTLVPVITSNNNITSIEWHDGSTQDYYLAEKTENISVKVTDNENCYRYDTISLLVNPLPEFKLSDDTVLCDLTEKLILEPKSGTFAQYNWRSSVSGSVSIDGYIEVGPALTEDDYISLTVTDNNNCSYSDTIVIFTCNIEDKFNDMNNAITPNGDGDNDVWNLTVVDLPVTIYNSAVLEIFDRWGRLVFRTENVLEEPWDGTSKGKDLPMDAYYYVLKLNAYNAPPIMGTVNLIR